MFHPKEFRAIVGTTLEGVVEKETIPVVCVPVVSLSCSPDWPSAVATSFRSFNFQPGIIPLARSRLRPQAKVLVVVALQ